MLIALGMGLLVTASGVGMDWLLHETHRQVFASDIFEGVVASIFCGLTLARSQRRRRELLIRMQAIEDVNHHVRNALTAITYSAALKDDPGLADVIDTANRRIDWVLREVLPQSARSQEDARVEIKSPWPQGAQVQEQSSGKPESHLP